MTPQEFCQRSRQVLRLASDNLNARDHEALAMLLDYFAADAVTPATFELQLQLLAEGTLRPSLHRAAARVLEVWRSERERIPALARMAQQN